MLSFPKRISATAWGGLTAILVFICALAWSEYAEAQTDDPSVPNLTIDLPGLLGTDRGWPIVRMYSRSVDGRQLRINDFGAVRTLSPDASGNIVVLDVPPTDTYPEPQEYVVSIGGNHYSIAMPDTDSDFKELLRRDIAVKLPCIYSSTTPTGTYADGKCWYDSANHALSFHQGGSWVQPSASPLDSFDRNAIDKAVQADANSIYQDGLETVYRGADDTSEVRIASPGLTVEDESHIQGSASRAHILDCVGDGVQCTVSGTRATVSVPGGAGVTLQKDGTALGTAHSVDTINILGTNATVTRSGNTVSVQIAGSSGGGLTQSQVETIVDSNPKVVSAEDFEDAFRHESTLIDGATWTQGLSNAASRIIHFPIVPLDRGDGEFKVKIGATGTLYTFKYSVLRALPAVIPSAQLTDSNSLRLTEGGVAYRLARRSGNNEWLVASENTGLAGPLYVYDDQIRVDPFVTTIPASRVAVDASRFTGNLATTDTDMQKVAEKVDALAVSGGTVLAQIEDFAKKSSTDTVPPAKIPLASSTQQGGINSGSLVRILGSITYAEAESAAALNSSSLDGADTFLFIDESASTPKLRRVQKAQLDHLWMQSETKFTEHQEAVFSAFDGDDHWHLFATGRIQGASATRPTLADLRATPESGWVASFTTGAVVQDQWWSIRIPTTDVAKATGNLLRFELHESEGDVYPAIPSENWGSAVGTNAAGTYTYYSVQVPDYASGTVLRVEEIEPIELDDTPGRIDVAQWNRVLGHSGVQVFTELYPGITGSSIGSNVEPSTALALSPTFDLDTVANQRGEFHFSLELALTQANAQASFVVNQANPTSDDKQFTASIVVFASDLLEESTWGVGNTRNGLSLFRATVYVANTEQGTLHILLVRDSDNEVAVHRYWSGAAGNYPFAISGELRGSFSRTDAPTEALTEASLDTDGATWAVSGDMPTGNTAYTLVSGAIGNTNFTVPADAPSGVSVAGASNRLYVALPEVRPDDGILGLWVVSELSEDNGATWKERHRIFQPWGPGVVTTDHPSGGTSPATGILTLDEFAATAGRTAAIVGVTYAVYEGHGGSFIYVNDQGGPRPRAQGPAGGGSGAGTVAYRWRIRVFPSDLTLAGLQGPKGDKGDSGAATVLDADFTPSMAATALGSVSTTASPRTLTAPIPVTVGLAADGTLPAGVTVASNVITFANAGRVVLDGVFIVQAKDTATNNNNSRSRVVLWTEKASSTGNFAAVRGSASSSEYIRVSHDYWNHGAGYTYLHDHAEFVVAAGDRIRLRIAALFNQASTVTHSVVTANPDSNLLPGSGFHITHVSQ